MATISTGGSEGGKRAVDHEIPLIPFIDLLLCCIMFLLVTAVWNQLSSLDASLEGGQMDQPPPAIVAPPIRLRVAADGYQIVGSAGDEVTIPRASDAYDVGALRDHLRARRAVAPNEDAMVVTADDGVAYADIVQAMDALAATGFDDVTVSGTM